MKHIVFDIDGTMIDTEQALLYSLRDTLKTVTGKEYAVEDLVFALGITSRDCLVRMGVENVAEAMHLWDRNAEGYNNMVTIFPGIREVLEACKARGCRLGIVTSRNRYEYEAVFVPLGLGEYFDTVILADATQRHKPAADPLLKYAELAQADVADMVYIGDSPYDKGCADNAGVRFYLAGWGARQSVPVEEGFRAEKPEDLLNMLF